MRRLPPSPRPAARRSAGPRAGLLRSVATAQALARPARLLAVHLAAEIRFVLPDHDRDVLAGAVGGDVGAHQLNLVDLESLRHLCGLRFVAAFEHDNALGEAVLAVADLAGAKALRLEPVAYRAREAVDGRVRAVEDGHLDLAGLHRGPLGAV